MEKKSLADLRKEVCENKIITVMPIGRRKAYLKRGKDGQPHDGEDIYTGCQKGYGLAWNLKKHSYNNPFRTENEQEAFERLLDQKEGSLNLFKFESKFWGDFLLKLPKEGVPLDLNNPADALMYRVLLTDPKAATSESEKSIVEKEYILLDDTKIKEEESVLSKKKDEANDFMYKLKKNKRDMFNTLRLLGKKPSPDSSAEWLRSELYKIIDEVATVKGKSGLDKFLDVMKDSRAEIKLFVLDAIDIGAIVREQSGYKLEYNGKFVGMKYEDVVNYFSGNTPEILEQKQLIEEIIKH